MPAAGPLLRAATRFLDERCSIKLTSVALSSRQWRENILVNWWVATSFELRHMWIDVQWHLEIHTGEVSTCSHDTSHTTWSSQMILKYLILLVLVRHDQTWQEPTATSCRNVRRAKGLTWTKALSSIATSEANTDTLRVKANQEKIICIVLEACEEPCLAISTLYTVGCSHRPYQNTWEHPRTVYLSRGASVNK